MTLVENFIKIQSELKAPKNQYNSFGKYNYRSCEDILSAAKPLACESGCYINVTDDVVLVGERVYVKATASITDGKNEISAVGWAREPLTKKGMDESQITGATSSYARKYALNGLFGIDDTKDADTDEYKKQENKQKDEPKQQPKKEKPSWDDEKKYQDLKDYGERLNNVTSADELLAVQEDYRDVREWLFSDHAGMSEKDAKNAEGYALRFQKKINDLTKKFGEQS